MDTIEKLSKFLATEFSTDNRKGAISPDENLLTQGIIDSMGILKLVAFIENTFGIKISNDDILPENFQSLNCLKEFIEKKTG
jgi:acyl carrier protein